MTIGHRSDGAGEYGKTGGGGAAGAHGMYMPPLTWIVWPVT